MSAHEEIIKLTTDADKLKTFSTDIHPIEDLFEFKVNHEVPEEVAYKQGLVNQFDNDLKQYKKNIEQKQKEIKLLEKKIVEYEIIKKMWIKEADAARVKLKIYEKFHAKLKEITQASEGK